MTFGRHMRKGGACVGTAYDVSKCVRGTSEFYVSMLRRI